jgi:putative MATE family efflux protein
MAFRALLQLSLPAIVQQVMGSVLQYVDTAMVGHLGEAATAAVSTSTTVNWLIHSIPTALTVGCLSLLSQAYGRGSREELRRLSALTVHLALWWGLGLTAICLAISPFLPVWMQTDPAVQHAASAYFFIVSLPLAFFVAGSMFAAAMQALKDTRTPMLIHLGANALNLVLNYLLIYRLALGVQGAAIATAVSTVCSGTGMAIAFRRKTALRFRRQDYLPLDRVLLRKVMAIAGPILGTTVVSCLGYIVFAGMVNGMGITIFAAHSIAITAEEIFYLPGYGLRTASSALIGIAIGENNPRRYQDTRHISLVFTALLMVLSGAILFFTAHPLMRLFTSSETVALMGAKVLRLVAFSEPLFGLMVAWEGVFYGIGQTHSVFVIESLSMWGIRILFTYLAIHHWHLGLEAVWYCMIADNACKAIALTAYGMRHPFSFPARSAPPGIPRDDLS